MSLSTNLVSGLSSGFDWRSMIDQLIALEHKPVDLVEEKKSNYESQLSEWQSFNTKLLGFKTAAGALSAETGFSVYVAGTTSNTSTSPSDLLTVSTSSTATQGTYNIKVNNLAQSERISSKNYTDIDTALSLSGDFLVSGKAVNVVATDTLAGIKNKINALNTGENPSNVTASIVSYGTDNYHLVLSSDETGEDGLSVLEGACSGGNNILQDLGLISSGTQIKTSTSDGAKSDLFSSSNGVVGTLLGLTSAPGATTVQIGGNNVDIDLSSQSITTIAQNIDALAGVSASVVSETVDGETRYRIDVSGTTSFTDNGNVLQTLGILEGTYTSVTEVHTGSVANTTGGGATAITENTQWNQIDGANVQANTSFTITGKKHDGTEVSGSFTISGTTAQVSELLNYIETTVFGSTVSATISAEGKIQITDTTSGDSQLEMILATNNQGAGALDFGTVSMTTEGRSMQLAAGEDAEIVVDNVVITNSSNTISSVITGVTLNLVGEDTDTTVTLKVDRDIDTIMETISTFVDSYNEVISYICQQQSYDEDEEETGGVLFGDGTLSSVKSDLTTTLLESVWGVSSEYATLGLVGIEQSSVVSGQDYEPTLSIDTDTLRGYLETNFSDVKSLFSVNGSPSVSTIEYISYSNDTEAGEYTVNITQAATQSTSTNSDNGTVGEDETLTITEGDKIAQISLKTTDSLSAIKNAINSELSTVYTETLVGDQQLYEGSGGTTVLRSTTAWDQVYLDGSTSAGVLTGDRITFTGTTRSGTEVSGSYDVTNASSDKVQGVLSAIETAYGNDITASIDTSGRLVITDKYEGNSQLSIALDYTNAHSLTFGTSVSTTNTGGQEGRYAMAITATEDAGSLVLTHDSYGSAYTFSISEDAADDNNKLWTGGDQTVNNGVDVAGTINGEAATGSGQTLTGDDGETNVDGLVIKYTGSTTGDVGNIKLTLGVGELFDRALFNITDSYDGYVAFKQDSLQDSINSLEIRIENMETRLNSKMERMINQFVAMEVALAQIQSQSQWLTGQINASYSGWV
ncbi:MAG: flagellar filament capping protein FliD [Deltaproteobacteria bacterium]|nr:flagellar filament capping protein FliD [Deltaproteobacteria bacterium]